MASSALPVLPSLPLCPPQMSVLGPVTGLGQPGPALVLGLKWLTLLRALLLSPKPFPIGLTPFSPVCHAAEVVSLPGSQLTVHIRVQAPFPGASSSRTGWQPGGARAGRGLGLLQEAPWSLRKQRLRAGQRCADPQPQDEVSLDEPKKNEEWDIFPTPEFAGTTLWRVQAH